MLQIEIDNIKELINKQYYKSAITKSKYLLVKYPDNMEIKFLLAKSLIKSSLTQEEGKKILIELLNTDMKNDSILELGYLELENSNIEKASICFKELINTKYKNNALLGLGKLELKNNNYKQARYYFEKIQNSELCTDAMLELGIIEIKEHNEDIAKKYFDYLIKLDSKNKNNAILQLIYLEIRNNNLNLVYELLDIIDYSTDILIEIKNIKYYLNYQKNIISLNEINNNYYFSQMSNYNKNDVIKHIKENNYFINLKLLFKESKLMIKKMNPTSISLVDKYIIEYKHNIAKINNQKTNKIKIITLPNTKNIIEMYPIY